MADLEGFWASIWERFDVIASAPYERVLGSRAMPGAEWFPGARLNFAEHVLRPRRRRGRRDSPRLGAAAAGRADAGRAAGRGGAGRGRPARARRRAGRPGGRVSAEHPGGGDRVPRLRVDRRDLVELLAGLRRAQRDRPLRADHAEGAARRRRLPLRRQGLRPARRSCGQLLGSLPTVEHTVVLGYLDPDPSLDGPRRRARLGGAAPPRRGCRRSRSSRCRPTIRSGCSTARARPGCRRRSCTATAGSCSRC